MRGADLNFADLRDANLRGAHLNSVDLRFAYTASAHLDGPGEKPIQSTVEQRLQEGQEGEEALTAYEQALRLDPNEAQAQTPKPQARQAPALAPLIRQQSNRGFTPVAKPSVAASILRILLAMPALVQSIIVLLLIILVLLTILTKL